MYSIESAFWLYRNHGLKETVRRIALELSLLVLAGVFGILDRVIEVEENYLCMIPREASLDQDGIALIEQATNNSRVKLSVAISSPNDIKKDKLEIENVEFFRYGSLQFIRQLARAEIVVTKDRLWQYRLLSAASTQFIRIPHGLPVKASRTPPNTGCGLRDVIGDLLSREQNYVYTVASELEMHREAGVMGRKRENLRMYGYPRFDRVRYLAENPDKTLLPRTTMSELDNHQDNYTILYASTHKDSVYDTELFPFSDKDLDELRSFFRENGIRILVRPHIREDNRENFEQYLDGTTIIYAGSEFADSAVELMPYVDALMTDFSSIYLDYILFDRPLLFVQDDIEAFRDLRGFAFDYDMYWPGPKITSQDEFLDELIEILEGNDKYEYERQFVRDTFHPPKGESFLENII